MNFPPTKLLPLILILFIFPVLIGTTEVRCLEKERLALLKIKADMEVNDGWVEGWGTKGNEEDKKDCCRWHSVICDNNTNHVVRLIFTYPATGTKISPSLLDLVDLIHLTFLEVDFNGIPIPEFMGSFGKLQHLYMPYSNIGGSIPHHLGNLSMLRSLDLCGNELLNITDLDWLANFHSLEYLDLSYVDLSRATTWMQVINNLPKLNHLNLQSCGLSSSNLIPPSLPLNNTCTRLSYIDLSRNSLNTTSIFTQFLQVSSSLSYVDFSSTYMRGKIPDALGNLSLLSHVDLSKNSLEGGVPTAFWNSTMLGYLDLSENLLHGSLPNVLKLHNLEVLNLHSNGFVGIVSDMRWCTSLKVVNLHGNMFNGTLNARIGYLSKLETLDLGSNHLKGTISEAHFFNLSRLQTLDLSFNSNLTVKINSRWNPPFRLETISLAYCNLGPKFPSWILKSCLPFASVDISNARISDTINFWNSTALLIESDGNTSSFCFTRLNMSFNQISGIPPDLSCSSFESADLSSNDFNGSLPRLNPSMEFVNLARNKFFGTLTNTCDAIWVTILDLSDNQLSGELPHCLMNLTNLEYLNLANNFFSGEIPKSFGYMKFLISLHLRNNNFGGEISTALRECSWLLVLDLGENKLYGNIPAWIGTSLPYLAVLSLKSNDFYGNLPSTLCHLQNLQLLDLSLNKISGTIPKCIGNFSSMTSKTQPYSQYRHPYNDSQSFSVVIWSGATLYDTIQIIWKGKDIEYIRNLELLKAIDLSSNKFTGEIPLEMTSLVGLFALNISRNNLVGSIPPNIFRLELLNFLDLSQNNLSGHILDTLSQLSHLGVLNLSFNNLSGRIPWDTHMQTFNSFSYLGNPQLCGPPLSKSCPEDHVTHKRSNSTDDDEFITTGFYISMTLGFIFGFWGILGTLILNKFCRHIWFKMLI